MPSLINILTMTASCLALATGSAIPLDSSATIHVLDKRATLETCPGINNKLVRAERFRVRCDTDTLYSGGREESVQAPDFDDSMGKCEGINCRSWCKFVSWNAKIDERGDCYLKAGNGYGRGDSGSAYYKTAKGVKLGIRR
ncbi:hypothetical protein Slin15195_G046140 [Septoria linicola]|uniref:Apple domain-containing protein n=1 Tax=Septoria linicola TaxID=215465 RepID=A0A9Q9ARP3_9PEZI|nr:hypothetical protein Slin14017_G049670 [Septoria linicola]USW51295.1 hypothetical protein Slin15195_G046140 [Septoria linicola]